MDYILDIKPSLMKTFRKIAKKDPRKVEIIMKKVDEILRNPHRYKNLRSPLEDWKRIHVDKHFVLCYSINEEEKVVTLEDYDHHDNIYKH
jgi:YafQ family addiction module toxin component